MNRYHLKLIIILTLLLSTLNIAHANVGKYFNSVNESEFIELQENHNFVIYESGMKIKGKYNINNSNLILNFKFNKKDYSVKALFENNIIKDKEGKVWVKINKTPPILISVLAAIMTIILISLSNKISNKYLKPLSQLGSVFIGVLFIVSFAESAIQARSEIGKYYFYILIVAAIISKVISMKRAKNEAG